ARIAGVWVSLPRLRSVRRPAGAWLHERRGARDLAAGDQIANLDIQSIVPRRERLHGHGDELPSHRPDVLAFAAGLDLRDARAGREQSLHPDPLVLFSRAHDAVVLESRLPIIGRSQVVDLEVRRE